MWFWDFDAMQTIAILLNCVSGYISYMFSVWVIGQSTIVLIVVHVQTEQFVIRLLQRGAIVTIAGPDGNTPLHLAAVRGFVNVGRSLLDHDAKTMAKNNEMQIPLQVAIKNNHNDFAVLMTKSMEPSRSGNHSVPCIVLKEML